MGLLESIRAVWQNLSGGYRTILVLLCVLSVGAIFAVVSWGGSPRYQVLATNLAAKDCAALASALADADIPVSVNDGGDTVLVAGARLSEARLVAAEKGIAPASQTGFDIFQKPKFGMTSDAQRVVYLNALQNELAQTIASLEPVAEARVHLVIPQRRLFPGDRIKPTASVLIIARRQRAFTSSHAAAVASIVAGAVEGLSVDNVTVTDERGTVISGAAADATEAVASDRFAYQQRMESYLSRQVESMLGQVLGPGRCRIRVCVELAFEDRKELNKTYDASGVKAHQTVESTTTTGTSMTVGGAVGSAANVAGEAGEASGPVAAAPVGSTKEKIETEWMVGSRVLEEVKRGASIKKLMVAAFVDLSAPAAAGGEGGETAAAASGARLSLEDIRKIIQDAVGYDAERGDSVQVLETTFAQPAAAAGVSAGLLDRYGWAGKWIAVSALGLVLLIVVRRAMAGLAAAPRQAIVPEIMGARAEGGASADELLRREVGRFVEGSPEAAGRLIEGWIEGEEQ